jgi:RimJ/RimL family protein N-acetyltransferase
MTPDDLDDMAVQPVDGMTELEVGYDVAPALQGRGYATDAAAGLA